MPHMPRAECANCNNWHSDYPNPKGRGDCSVPIDGKPANNDTRAMVLTGQSSDWEGASLNTHESFYCNQWIIKE